MASIPGQFERDLAELNQKHSSIHCRIGIIANAGLRTTPSGDAMVDARRHQEATRKRIEADLDDYCRMVRALAGISS
jgi:hypothetical protein